jgi:hypothetical protein
MTSSTPSILPAPVDAGRSADAASFSRTPRQGTTERSFEEFCSDASCGGQQKPTNEVPQEPRKEVQQQAEAANEPDGESDVVDEQTSVADETTPTSTVSEQPAQQTKPGDVTVASAPVGIVSPTAPDVSAGTQTAVAVGQLVNESVATTPAVTPLATPVSTNTASVPATPEAKTAPLTAETPVSVATDPKSTAQKPIASTLSSTKEQEEAVDAEHARRPKLGRFGGRQGNPSVEGEEGKVFRANFAARHGISQEPQEGKGPKDFLTIGKQILTKLRSLGGTDTAIPADSMNLAPKFSAQPSGLRHSQTQGVGDFSGGAGTQFSWKGVRY